MAANLSPQMRKDSINSRWVIFSPARSRRPSDFKSKSAATSANQQSSCPFCLGREHDCAPEIFRVAPDHSPSDWSIRVIQNLYPALSREVDPSLSPNLEVGNGDVAISGFGYHDVVIESPIHEVHLWDLGDQEVGEVILAYKKRIEQISSRKEIKYVQVFKNHGASAGASMSHSHSQIMALPVVPPIVSTRLDSMKEHFSQTGECSLCKINTDGLLIDRSAHFISIAPFAAASPFEIWIIPVYHSSHFHEIDSDKATDLGGLLKLMLKKISLQLNNPPFNFMIQSSPLGITSSHLPYSHWYLQIVPQLSGVGGFEIGSGCYINPVFPEDVAKVLRDVSVSN